MCNESVRCFVSRPFPYMTSSPACDETAATTLEPYMMSHQLQSLRLIRVILAILAAAVLGNTTDPSGGVTPFVHETFEEEDFTCADAIRLIPPGVGSPVILQLFNKEYLKMEENFLLVLRQNAPQRLRSMYLVCFDGDSVARMDALFGLPCAHINGVTNRRLLLATRVKMIRCLVQGGHDVLVSDNDALWLADPIPDLRATAGNMLFQRGTYPPEYKEPVHGLTLCDGFALYRAGGQGMDKFLELIINALQDTKSDQVAHNQAAHLLGLTWDYNESNSDMRRFNSTAVGRGVLTALPDTFTVILLPHNKYTRRCKETPITSETLIAHCFPRGKRVAAMKRANLWLAD